MDNQTILKGTITTDSVTNGLLAPEQSRKFLQQTFESTDLMKIIRHVLKTNKTGEIDKIGIGRRLIRAKTENYDDNHRASVNFGKLNYACVNVRLPWELSEETLQENIEGGNLDKIITDMMTAQIGVDMEDLHLNADTETAESDPDYDFLKLNDGWMKQLLRGGHVIDRSSKGGALDLDVFYDALKVIPRKYRGKLRWLMSTDMKAEWDRHLFKAIVENGATIPESLIRSPANVPVVEVTNLADDKIILTDPQNLCAINTVNMKIRKTTEGREAVMQDKRLYVAHLDFDSIIEELDAAAIITGFSL